MIEDIIAPRKYEIFSHSIEDNELLVFYIEQRSCILEVHRLVMFISRMFILHLLCTEHTSVRLIIFHSMSMNFLGEKNLFIYFDLIGKHYGRKSFHCYLDAPGHYSYHTYGPEYYPGPSYPIYPEEEYFSPPIHVKSNLCCHCSIVGFFLHFEGSTTSIDDFTWW